MFIRVDLSGSTNAVADGSGILSDLVDGFTAASVGFAGGRATAVDFVHSGSDVTARMNPFGFSFFFSLPPAFCSCFSGSLRKNSVKFW